MILLAIKSIAQYRNMYVVMRTTDKRKNLPMKPCVGSEVMGDPPLAPFAFGVASPSQNCMTPSLVAMSPLMLVGDLQAITSAGVAALQPVVLATKVF